MSLENVSIWDSNHGWHHTTPNKAIKLYPHGVQSMDSIFLCESCEQYVSFVVGDKAPFFRHPVGSNDCKDKMTARSEYYRTNKLGFSLPIKIRIDGSKLAVFIGFLPIPIQLMKINVSNGATVKIFGNQKELTMFLINFDRFSSNHVTYISIGNTVCEKYYLSLSNTKPFIANIWPIVVNGFDSGGTLFDPETWKRLPAGADVEIGRKYYLITRRYFHLYYSDIYIKCVRHLDDKWMLYEVSAMKLSKDASAFFLQFGARLTDLSACIVSVWPPSVCASHVITYEQGPVIFYHRGGCVEVWPSTKLNCTIEDSSKGTIQSFNSDAIQQVLSVSRFAKRTTVLRYIVLNKKLLSPDNQQRDTFVTDIQGNCIKKGEYRKLPLEKCIKVRTCFDGYAEVKIGDWTVGKIEITGGEFTIIHVQWNCTISVYQGCDLVYEIEYKRKQREKTDSGELLKKLNQYQSDIIVVQHNFGRLAAKLIAYPGLKKWLAKQIHRGTISQYAIDEIKRFIIKNC